MKYNQPLGTPDGTSYSDGDQATNVPGSVPTALALEHPQREIVNVITAAGLTPDENDLNQLNTAVQTFVSSGAGSYALTDLTNVDGANVVSKIGTGDITASHLASTAVATAEFADNSVTLAKFAHGTAGKIIGFNASGIPAELDPILPQVNIQDAFATKVLVDLDVTEANNSYGTYYLQDMTQGGMTVSGGGRYVSGTGYSWGTEVNLALGSTATASSIYNETDHQPSNVVDDLYVHDGLITYTEWMNAQGTWPHWWQTDLGQSYIINTIEVYAGLTYGAGPYSLLASNDGSNWTTVDTSAGVGTYGVITHTLNGVDAWRYFRVSCSAPWDPVDVYAQHFTSLQEFRALQTGSSGEATFTSGGIDFAKANPSDIALYALIDEAASVTEGTDRIFELADGSGGSIGTYATPSAVDDFGLFLGKRMVRATFDMSAKPATSCTYRIKLNNVEQTIASAVVVPLYY